MATATLDTNSKGATAATIAITTQTLFSLYVFARTGDQGKYRIGLEASPDGGTTWIELDDILMAPGVFTCNCSATNIRVKVIEPQGSTSTVTVHLIGK